MKYNEKVDNRSSKGRSLRILHVAPTLNPALGGVPETTLQLTKAMREIGVPTEIVTLDAPGAAWLKTIPEVVHAMGPCRGKYSYTPRVAPWLIRQGKYYDAVITHGIWQYHSLATWRAARVAGFPYFIRVAGALDPWYKHEYPLKHVKKWLYWPWAEYRVLRDARAVLFTNEEERLSAKESFWLYRVREAVANIGIRDTGGDTNEQKEQFLTAFPHLRSCRNLLFLSRIHPVKGCDLLIRAFSRVASLDERLHLVMAGPDQVGWQRDLEDLAKSYGVLERITWTGMLKGGLKWGAYRASEVFVLPSHTENFGVVVAEALACGLPVVITNKVKIWHEVVNSGAGFADSDTVEGITTALKQWLMLSVEEKERMRVRARACFEENFEIKQAARNFVSVIERHLPKVSVY